MGETSHHEMEAGPQEPEEFTFQKYPLPFFQVYPASSFDGSESPQLTMLLPPGVLAGVFHLPSFLLLPSVVIVQSSVQWESVSPSPSSSPSSLRSTSGRISLPASPPLARPAQHAPSHNMRMNRKHEFVWNAERINVNECAKIFENRNAKG